VLVHEGTPPHEVHALDLDAAANQLGGRRAAPFACVAAVALGQELQVVIECTHPGSHFFFFGTGQEADVFTHAHGGTGHDDFGVAALVEHLREAAGQRHQ